MTKSCKRCHEVKPLTDFARSSSAQDGHGSTCKPCVVARNREYWRTPKGRISQIIETCTKAKEKLLKK